MFFRVFIVILFFISTTVFAQGADCGNLLPVCGNLTLKYNPQGKGANDFANAANMAGCFSQGENNSAWYKIRIIKDGTLTFMLVPDNPRNDYDFGIWGPNASCTALGSPIRCNTAAEEGETGLTLTSDFTSQGPGNGSNKCKFLDVKAGEEYVILVDNASRAAGASFQLNFGGTAALGEVVEADFLINPQDCGVISLISKATSCTNSDLLHEWKVIDSKGAVVATETFESPKFNLSAGSYQVTLTVTSLGGTKSTKTKIIDITDKLTTTLSTKVQCNQITSAIKVASCYNTDFTYIWDITDETQKTKVFSQTLKSNTITTNLPNGNYKMTIKATNALGSTITKDTTFVIDVASINIIASEKACFENNAKTALISKVNSKNLPTEYKIEWYEIGKGKIGEGDKIEITNAGYYNAVMLYDVCKIKSDTFLVKEYCPPVVYVPTAFSPNGDGLNDNLRVWGKRFVNLTVEVYNQWGNVIFINKIPTENESVTWDGVSTNGVPIQSGSYVVQVSYFDAVTSRPISERHVVSIIR